MKHLSYIIALMPTVCHADAGEIQIGTLYPIGVSATVLNSVNDDTAYDVCQVTINGNEVEIVC